MQSNFGLSWAKDSSLKPFELNQKSPGPSSQSKVHQSPIYANYSGIHTKKKPTDAEDPAISLAQVEQIKKEHQNRKGHLKNFLADKSTAEELKSSALKNQPVSQRMIAQKDSARFLKGDSLQDERKKWELKAQICRHIFKMSRVDGLK